MPTRVSAPARWGLAALGPLGMEFSPHPESPFPSWVRARPSVPAALPVHTAVQLERVLQELPEEMRSVRQSLFPSHAESGSRGGVSGRTTPLRFSKALFLCLLLCSDQGWKFEVGRVPCSARRSLVVLPGRFADLPREAGCWGTSSETPAGGWVSQPHLPASSRSCCLGVTESPRPCPAVATSSSAGVKHHLGGSMSPVRGAESLPIGCVHTGALVGVTLQHSVGDQVSERIALPPGPRAGTWEQTSVLPLALGLEVQGAAPPCRVCTPLAMDVGVLWATDGPPSGRAAPPPPVTSSCVHASGERDDPARSLQG
ncbi:uncharacterized protein LOC106734232 [Tupaia chinensis]|uniref:uncharacterized protein LOC106734232 n=1 Tax=Tupaia chinensis TaxID=246437 RepID=UPI0007047E5C|nr:uncharacterized protein LOC106734232 [Tupaia chinensis]